MPPPIIVNRGATCSDQPVLIELGAFRWPAETLVFAFNRDNIALHQPRKNDRQRIDKHRIPIRRRRLIYGQPEMNITKRRKPRSRKRPVDVFPPQISPEPRLLTGGLPLMKAATLPRGEAAPDDDPFQTVRTRQISQRVVQPHKRRLEGKSVKVGVRPNVDCTEVGAGAEVVFRQGSIAFPEKSQTERVESIRRNDPR